MLGFSRRLVKIKMQLSPSKLEMPWILPRTSEVQAKFKLSFSKSGEGCLVPGSTYVGVGVCGSQGVGLGVGKWEGWIVYNTIHALKEFTVEYRRQTDMAHLTNRVSTYWVVWGHLTVGSQGHSREHIQTHPERRVLLGRSKKGTNIYPRASLTSSPWI